MTLSYWTSNTTPFQAIFTHKNSYSNFADSWNISIPPQNLCLMCSVLLLHSSLSQVHGLEHTTSSLRHLHLLVTQRGGWFLEQMAWQHHHVRNKMSLAMAIETCMIVMVKRARKGNTPPFTCYLCIGRTGNYGGMALTNHLGKPLNH